MTPISESLSKPTAQLDCALQSAVAQNWDELMPDSKSGLIHIEYQTGHDGSLDFMLIWASTVRGYWNLVCEFWLRPLWFHTIGLRFSNNYYSAAFARTLQYLMGEEGAFAKLPDKHGLIQVYPPKEERRDTECRASVATNYQGFNRSLVA
ncbi:MAG TPA: hypothetical protein VN577_08145 [Terriglobales bacterium]|nr:hypothetical protein [Terriglobales bacterium]